MPSEISWSLNEYEAFTDKLRHGLNREGLVGFNSRSYNSDEFKTIHEEKHFLFSGCSNTFGVGIEKEETWAYLTYLKIKDMVGASGFFNISSPGIGIQMMVIDIFRYCNEFGNPDTIFINLSNQLRVPSYTEKSHGKDGKVRPGFAVKHYDHASEKDTIFMNYNIYMMLEVYCKYNNIQLYSFTWDNKKTSVANNFTNTLFKEFGFKTFYPIDYDKMIEEIFLIKEKAEDVKYFEVARDGHHFGKGYHEYWSNFIFNEYMEANYDK